MEGSINSTTPATTPCGPDLSLPTYNLNSPERNGLAFLGVLNTLLVCPTFVANSLVLLVIWKKPIVRCNAVYLLGFLAVTDVLVGIVAQPLFVAYTVQVLLYRTPSCFVMMAYDFSSILLCFWSATTSLLVTVDRCVAVLCPYKYRTLVTAPRLMFGVLFTWLAWSLYVFSRFLGVSGRVFALVRSSMFLVSIVVTSAVYVKMVLISRKSGRLFVTQADPNATQRAEVKERKVLKTALFVVGAYLICYLPLTALLQMFFIVRPPKQTRFITAHWCTSLVFIDSLLNPLIYWWRIPRMRMVLLELIRRTPKEISRDSKKCQRDFTEISKEGL